VLAIRELAYREQTDAVLRVPILHTPRLLCRRHRIRRPRRRERRVAAVRICRGRRQQAGWPS